MSETNPPSTLPPGAPATGTGTGIGTGNVVIVPPKPRPNPFAPIATLMRSMPSSLEATKSGSTVPRYVRIAKLRNYLKPVKAEDEKVAKAMASSVGYFITAMAYVMKYSLKLQDLTEQVDAGKAMLETSLDLVETVTNRDFLASIALLEDDVIGSGMDVAAVQKAMAPVNEGLDAARRIIELVTEPQDLDVIGQHLYRMLVIEWVDAPTTPTELAAETAPIDIAKTGKLRLLLWALGKPYAPLDGGAGSDVAGGVSVLGLRRLRRGATTQAVSSVGTWKDPSPGGTEVNIFECAFKDATAGADIRELQAVLKAFGYPLTGAVDGIYDEPTALGVGQFQHLNDLPVTGAVDEATVNQLMHLRYDPVPTKGRMCRAKSYDESKLAGFTLPPA